MALLASLIAAPASGQVAAPFVSVPSNGASVVTTTPTIIGRAGSNTNITVYIDDVAVGTSYCFDGDWNLSLSTPLSYGSHRIRAIAKDRTGFSTSPSSSTNTFTVARPPVVTEPADGATTGATPTYRGSAPANSTVTVYVDARPIGNSNADSDGGWRQLQPTPLADGSHAVYAVAAAYGFTSANSASVNFTVAPTAAPVVVTPANGAVTNNETPTYTGTSEPFSRITVYVDGSVIGGTFSTGASGNWSTRQPPYTLVDGSHTVYATAEVDGREVSANSNTNTFTTDTVPPPAPAAPSTPTGGSTTTNRRPIIGGVAEANSTITVIIDDAAVGSTTSSATGTWNFTPNSDLPLRDHLVSATATDAAGNTSGRSSATPFTVAQAPAVTRSPSDQTVALGQTATFRAEASGSPSPTVQWQVSTDNGVSFANVLGGRDPIYTTDATVTADSGKLFRAVFTTAKVGSATTAAAALTVVQAPTADNQSVTAVFQTATRITLTGSDPNTPARPVTYTATTGPAHGSLTGTAPNLTYRPTTDYVGPDSFTFTASNDVATSPPATVSIIVPAPAPAVTGVTPTSGTALGAAAATINGRYFTGATAVTIGGTAVTDFMVYDDTRIGVNMPAHAPGAVTVAVTTPQGTGSTAGAYTYVAPTITVAPTSLPSGTVGIAYSQTFTASGGAGTYTYAVTSGRLPAGMTLTSGGVLSGTPTAGGTFTFTLTASDGSTPSNGGPFTGSRTYTFVSNAPTIVIAPATLPGATTRVPYSQVLTASGGTAPYLYAVTQGTLPPGLTLSTGGVLSGTPTAAGSFSFTATARDSSTGSGPYNATRSYTLAVTAPITITPATLPDGTVETPYSATLTATGTTAPYSFAVTGGSLPPGLSLSSAGTIAGTPDAEGSYAFTVTATDSGSPAASADQAYTVAIGARAGGATRTWVASDGVDTNACSRLAPCATFAAAFAKVATGGEINCVDNGAYGTLTIDRAVSIVCGDKLGRAGVIVSGNDAIVVSAVGAKVVLSGLDVEGLGNSAATAGKYGVHVIGSGSVLIRNSTFRSVRGTAIAFEPGGLATLNLQDVTIADSGADEAAGSAGVLMRPLGGNAQLTANGLRITGGQQAGISLDPFKNGQVSATIVRSVVSDNAGTGVLTAGRSGSVRAVIVGSTLAGNQVGVFTGGGNLTVIGDSSIVGNAIGIVTRPGANTVTIGDNTLSGNAIDGAFTMTAGKQ